MNQDVMNMPNRRKYLRKQGFRAVGLSDKSGYWMQRDFSHPFLKKVEVCVETKITVYALDVDTKSHAAIHCCVYSAQKLKKILNWLKNDTIPSNSGL